MKGRTESCATTGGRSDRCLFALEADEDVGHVGYSQFPIIDVTELHADLRRSAFTKIAGILDGFPDFSQLFFGQGRNGSGEGVDNRRTIVRIAHDVALMQVADDPRPVVHPCQYRAASKSLAGEGDCFDRRDCRLLILFERAVVGRQRLFGDQILTVVAEPDDLGRVGAGIMKRGKFCERVAERRVFRATFEPTVFAEFVGKLFPESSVFQKEEEFVDNTCRIIRIRACFRSGSQGTKMF